MPGGGVILEWAHQLQEAGGVGRGGAEGQADEVTWRAVADDSGDSPGGCVECVSRPAPTCMENVAATQHASRTTSAAQRENGGLAVLPGAASVVSSVTVGNTTARAKPRPLMAAKWSSTSHLRGCGGRAAAWRARGLPLGPCRVMPASTVP